MREYMCVVELVFFLFCYILLYGGQGGQIKAAILDYLPASYCFVSSWEQTNGSLAMANYLTGLREEFHHHQQHFSTFDIFAHSFIFCLLFSHTTYRYTQDTMRRTRSGSWLLATSIDNHRNFFLLLSHAPFLAFLFREYWPITESTIIHS